MVQGDEAPLDWAALQDVCAYEGFGEVHGEGASDGDGDGGDGEASTPPEDGSGDGGDSAAAASSSDSDASDSSGGEPLFGAVTEPRVEADL